VSKRGTAGAHYWIGIRPKSSEEIQKDREDVDKKPSPESPPPSAK